MIVKSKMWLGREASCRLRRGSSVLLVMIPLLAVWLFVVVLVFVWLLFGFWLIVLIDCVCKRRRRTENCLKLSRGETKKYVRVLEGFAKKNGGKKVEWNKISRHSQRPFKSWNGNYKFLSQLWRKKTACKSQGERGTLVECLVIFRAFKVKWISGCWLN